RRVRDQLGVVGLRRRGREAVDADAVGGEVHGRRPHEVHQAALVEGVGDDAGGALPGVGRQDADDAAADAALDHRDGDVLGVEEVARGGDGDRPVEVLEAFLQDAPAAEQSGVVDQDVDPAPGVQRGLDVPLDLRLVADVAGDGHGGAPAALDAPHAG